MAKASEKLIVAINNTIQMLQKSNNYQWGHMGSCNCGFLAQEITKLSKTDIHKRAMQKHGDWNEQLNDYCPTSGLLMDDLISELLAFGLDTDDLKHLEKLSDPAILKNLPFEERALRHNIKSDVIKYLKTWSSKLESELINKIKLPHDISSPVNTIASENIC